MLFKIQGKGSLDHRIYDVYAVNRRGISTEFLIYIDEEWRGWTWIDAEYYKPLCE